MSFFTAENRDMHLKIDQIKSQVKAVSEIKPSNFTVNRDGSYDFFGKSGTYHADISRCSCPDFLKNKKGIAPCKHIYRIAIDSGLFEMPKRDKSAENKLKEIVPEELQKWKEAYLSGAIKAEKYILILQALEE